jgi:L-aspartate semialdehyde sulfurtransferase ferredoxin
MATRRVKLVYPAQLVDEPILYQLIQKFGLVTSVRKADASAEGGWLVLDLRGDDAAIQQALEWVRQLGIQVEELPH